MGVPVRVRLRAPKLSAIWARKNFTHIKDKKLVTKNNDFWFEKFSHKYEVEILFINDFFNLDNNEIINNINNLINSKKIQTVLFEGDHANIIDYHFLKRISNKVKKGIFLGDDMVWHIVNLITAQQCDFVFHLNLFQY